MKPPYIVLTAAILTLARPSQAQTERRPLTFSAGMGVGVTSTTITGSDGRAYGEELGWAPAAVGGVYIAPLKTGLFSGFAWQSRCNPGYGPEALRYGVVPLYLRLIAAPRRFHFLLGASYGRALRVPPTPDRVFEELRNPTPCYGPSCSRPRPNEERVWHEWAVLTGAEYRVWQHKSFEGYLNLLVTTGLNQVTYVPGPRPKEYLGHHRTVSLGLTTYLHFPTNYPTAP